MRTSIRVLALLALFVVIAEPKSVSAQVTQAQAAARLLSHDKAVRYQTFAMVEKLAVDDIGPGLRTAIIDLGAQVNRTVAEAIRTGKALSEVEDPEFVAAVLRQVALLRDPRAIAVLAEGGYYGGRNAIEALISFGEEAIPTLIRVARSDSHYDVVSHALIALGAIVEAPASGQLSAVSRGALRQLVTARLAPSANPPRLSVTWYAMELGVGLRDPIVTREIERIVGDSSALRARGVTETHDVERMRSNVEAKIRATRNPPN